MTAVSSLSRAGLAGIGEVSAARSAARASSIEPYRLDPLLALREGKIRVWDPDSLSIVPWHPWPNQEEDITAWIDVEHLPFGLRLRNVHVEKSRQEGDTTAYAYAFLWVLTFWPVPLLMQHQDLSEVADPGFTYDSFMGKIKLMWEHWPKDLARAPLKFTGGSSPIIRRLDSSTGFITGEGQTPDPGRGGRFAGGLVDEAARIRYAKQAQAALSRAVPTGRVYLSTPEGEGNVYYEIKQRRPRDWIFLRHHWADHPLYSRGLHVAGDEPGTCHRCAGVVAGIPYDPHADETHRFPGKPTSPWYDDAVVELTNEQVAQELDIDYAASLAARVYPEFNETLHVAVDEIRWDPHLPTETAWDFGVAPTSIVVCQDGPNEYRVLGDVEVYDATPETIARLLIAELRGLGVDETTIMIRAEAIRNVGDVSVRAASIATARPLTVDYAEQGFPIISQATPVAGTINSVKRLLGGRPKPLVVSPRAERFIRHAKANRWPVDRRGNRKDDAREPENDEHNHMMRAFAYLVYDKWPWEQDELEAAFDEARRAAFLREAPTGLVDPGLGYDMPL